MRIRVDAHHASDFERVAMPTPVQIQTPRIGIDLDCNAMLCACSENFFDVYVIARPTQELATRHMTEDRGTGISYRSKDPFGLFFPAKLKPAVDTGHDKIESGKDLVWVIQ